MRQKTSLIAALLHQPPLLMLDEPMVGSTRAARRRSRTAARARRARGGVLVSTHLLDVAERLCDRVSSSPRPQARRGSLAELRGASSDATLEDVFLQLTTEARGPWRERATAAAPGRPRPARRVPRSPACWRDARACGATPVRAPHRRAARSARHPLFALALLVIMACSSTRHARAVLRAQHRLVRAEA